jgi:hypothetical protein
VSVKDGEGDRVVRPPRGHREVLDEVLTDDAELAELLRLEPVEIDA